MEATLANRISMENTGGGQGNPEQGSFYSRPAEGVGIAQMKRSKIVPETSRSFGETLDIRESPEEEKDVGCGLQREREWWGEGTSSRDPILNCLVSLLQKEV